MQRFFGKGYLLQQFETCRTAFLCCDIQDRLRSHIGNFQDAVDVSNNMSYLQELLGPEKSVFLATVQYPDGLGPIASDIKLPPGCPPPFPKVAPSMLTEELAPYILGDKERGLEPVQQVVLWGHETQVCIINTADALLQHGIRVAVLVDGCASQRALDHNVSIQTMAAWEGLVLTTAVGAALQLTKGEARLLKPILQLTKRAFKPSNPGDGPKA